MLSSVFGPSEKQIKTEKAVKDLVTHDSVLSGLSQNAVFTKQSQEVTHGLWQDITAECFPGANSADLTNPLQYFNAHQNTFPIKKLLGNPDDEILAKKQLVVARLFKCAAEKAKLSLKDLLADVSKNPVASVEKEALQAAVSATLDFDAARIPKGSDLEVILSTYLSREEQVQTLFKQLAKNLSANLQAFGLEVSALRGFYSLAAVLVQGEALLVKNRAGKVSAQIAVTGDLKMLELLYPHIRKCACVHGAPPEGKEVSAAAGITRENGKEEKNGLVSVTSPDEVDLERTYCVLKSAAEAKQQVIVNFLFTTYALDFPTSSKWRLLSELAESETNTDMVKFLLDNYLEHFTTLNILSLMGKPGFNGVNTSYYRMLIAPSMSNVTKRLSGIWNSLPSLSNLLSRNGHASAPDPNATQTDPVLDALRMPPPPVPILRLTSNGAVSSPRSTSAPPASPTDLSSPLERKVHVLEKPLGEGELPTVGENYKGVKVPGLKPPAKPAASLSPDAPGPIIPEDRKRGRSGPKGN